MIAVLRLFTSQLDFGYVIAVLIAINLDQPNLVAGLRNADA